MSDREGDFSVDDARTALHDLAEALPVQQWHWYVISGTFLGIVREGGFLAHDYDIDVGVTFDPEHPEVSDAMIAALERSPRFIVKKVDDAQSVIETAPGRLAVRRSLALVKLIHETGINVDHVPGPRGPVVFTDLCLRQFVVVPASTAVGLT